MSEFFFVSKEVNQYLKEVNYLQSRKEAAKSSVLGKVNKIIKGAEAVSDPLGKVASKGLPTVAEALLKTLPIKRLRKIMK